MSSSRPQRVPGERRDDRPLRSTCRARPFPVAAGLVTRYPMQRFPYRNFPGRPSLRGRRAKETPAGENSRANPAQPLRGPRPAGSGRDLRSLNGCFVEASNPGADPPGRRIRHAPPKLLRKERLFSEDDRHIHEGNEPAECLETETFLDSEEMLPLNEQDQHHRQWLIAPVED
jgi:hypothetical protein